MIKFELHDVLARIPIHLELESTCKAQIIEFWVWIDNPPNEILEPQMYCWLRNISRKSDQSGANAISASENLLAV